MLRLSDIVSHAGLAFYPEVALVLFLLVFIGVLVRVFGPGSKRRMDHESQLPFEGEPAELPGKETRS